MKKSRFTESQILSILKEVYDRTALNMTGGEDHEQLDIVPATIIVIRHKR